MISTKRYLTILHSVHIEQNSIYDAHKLPLHNIEDSCVKKDKQSSLTIMCLGLH